MKKQKIAILLSLAWLFGMAAVFSVPPSFKNSHREHSRQSELKNISTPCLVSNISDSVHEVPTFKAGPTLTDFLSAQWSVDFIPSTNQTFAPSFFTKSRALFDVLITFFYFFYTW